MLQVRYRLRQMQNLYLRCFKPQLPSSSLLPSLFSSPPIHLHLHLHPGPRHWASSTGLCLSTIADSSPSDPSCARVPRASGAAQAVQAAADRAVTTQKSYGMESASLSSLRNCIVLRTEDQHHFATTAQPLCRLHVFQLRPSAHANAPRAMPDLQPSLDNRQAFSLAGF